MMNQIVQWSFLYPILAALVACTALAVINNLLFNILQIIDNMMERFQWWMIAGRLRDKDGNITREKIESFRNLAGKIDENETENTNNG